MGAESVGELLFQTTPSALDRLANIIESKAELTPRTVLNKKTGKEEPRVSGYRSELGGIEDIRLHGPTDRVKFSSEEAVHWMEQPNAIGGYIVELFRPDRSISPDAIDALVANLRKGLERLQGGLLVRQFLPSTSTIQFGEPSLTLSVQLTSDKDRLIDLPFLTDGRSAEISETLVAVCNAACAWRLDACASYRVAGISERTGTGEVGRTAAGTRNHTYDRGCQSGTCRRTRTYNGCRLPSSRDH